MVFLTRNMIDFASHEYWYHLYIAMVGRRGKSNQSWISSHATEVVCNPPSFQVCSELISAPTQ